MDLTLVSWNLLGSQQPDLHSVATALGELAPDVVALQEVQRRQLRTLREAGGFTDGTWSFKHWPVRAPAEGLGLLVRGGIIRRCSTQRLSQRECWWSWRRRIAQHAEVEVRGAVLPIVNVHLASGSRPAERLRQAERLLARRAPGAPVAGDLNDQPGSAVLARFAAAGLHDVWRRAHPGAPDPPTNWRAGPRTAPPVDRLDYVLVDDGVAVLDAFVPAAWQRYAPLSDHLPVVARLRPELEGFVHTA